MDQQIKYDSPSLTRFVYDGSQLAQEILFDVENVEGAWVYTYNDLTRDYLRQPGGIRQRERSGGTDTDHYMQESAGVIEYKIDRGVPPTIAARSEHTSSMDQLPGSTFENISNLMTSNGYIEMYGGTTAGLTAGFDPLVQMGGRHYLGGVGRFLSRMGNNSYTYSTNTNWASEYGISGAFEEECDYGYFTEEDDGNFYVNTPSFICQCLQDFTRCGPYFKDRSVNIGKSKYCTTQWGGTCYYECKCNYHCTEWFRINPVPCDCWNFFPKEPNVWPVLHSHCEKIGCGWKFDETKSTGSSYDCSNKSDCWLDLWEQMSSCAPDATDFDKCYFKECPECSNEDVENLVGGFAKTLGTYWGGIVWVYENQETWWFHGGGQECFGVGPGANLFFHETQGGSYRE